MNLTPIAEVADRYGVTDQAAAAIATATLEVIGVLSGDAWLVIARHKMRRSRNALRQFLSASRITKGIGLYFDGRKDKTLFMEKGVSGIYRQKFKKEEHISVVAEPGGNYIGHVSLKKGDAASIANEISNSVTNDFSAVGCDVTVVNTGSDGGAIQFLERIFGKSLQWLVCQLHFNELPFRALFVHIDGKTSGPESFTGEIGSLLKTSVNLKVVKFRRIPGNLPPLHNDMKTNDLSTDQIYTKCAKLFRVEFAVRAYQKEILANSVIPAG